MLRVRSRTSARQRTGNILPNSVLDGLRGEEGISELCRSEGVAQSIYYKWSKEFLEAGKRRRAGDCYRAVRKSIRKNRVQHGRGDFEVRVGDILERRRGGRKVRWHGGGDDSLAQWLCERGYKTVRGKRFFANHIHSILKRKRERDANQNREVRTEYRNFYVYFIERKLIKQS